MSELQQPAAVETEVIPPTNTPEPATGTEPQPAPADSENVQKRINRLVKARSEAERAREAAEQRAAELAEKLAAKDATKSDDSPPKQEDFDDYDAYLEARIAHAAGREVKTILATMQSEAAKHRELSEQNAAHARFAEKAADARKQYPDFDSVISEGANNVTLSKTALDALTESDLGPHIAYHLAKNPDEADAIADLPARKQVLAIGRLEERLETARKTKAPPLINPVGQSGTTTKDPDKMSMDEWWAHRAKKGYMNG